MRKVASLFTVLMLLCALAFGQERTITGTVTDENGNPVPFATVTEAGTKNATTADAQGNYKIKLRSSVSKLTISATGFQSQTQTPGANTQNFRIPRSESQLAEVVVTAIQTTRNKASVVYGSQTIRTEALNEVTNRSALNALQGKVAGVKIGQASGAPGASTRVVLRGETSLTQGNNALIVVDGVPLNNAAVSGGGGTGVNNGTVGGTADRDNYVDFGNRGNDINPDDIESITVLKGPAATSLYGSRGASGVILITTKKGMAREGAPKISVSSSVSRDKVYLIMEQQTRFGSGYKSCNGCGGGVDIFMGENFSWGAELDGRMIPWTAIPSDDGEHLLPLSNGKTDQLIRPYSAVEDHLENFFDIGTTNRNNISIDGGNDKYTYYLSYTNFNNKGIVPHSNYYKNNVLINAKAKFTDKLSSTFSLNYTKVNQRGVTEGGYAFGFSSGTPAYSFALQTPINIPYKEMRDYNSPYQDFKGFYAQYSINPYFILDQQKIENTVDNVLSSVSINYAFTNNFNVTGRASTNFSTSSVTEKNPRFQYLRALSWLDGELSDFGAPRSNSNFSLGSYKETTIRRIDLNFDVLGTYTKSFGTNYNLTVSAGFNSIEQQSRSIAGSTSGGLNVPGFYDLSNSKELPIAENVSSKYRLLGAYLNANLSYKEMLFLEYSARNDWSSTLPEDNRGFFYQAGGASFVASNAFNMNKKIISFLKLRANAGTTGKDAPLYRLDNYFNFNPTILDYSADYQIALPFNGVPGSRRSSLIGNPNLKPELTVTYEGGVDVGLFNDRLNLEYTYYYSNSKDQIVDANLPWSSGYALFPVNVGRMTNQGHELVVRGSPIKNSLINWNLFFTFSRNRNKVKQVAPEYGLRELNIFQSMVHFVGHGTMNLVAAEGLPFGTFKGTTFMYDSTTGSLIVDGTGNPKHSADQQYLGSYQPDYLASFGTDFSIKGITLHALFDARKGGLFYSATKLSTEFNGTALTTLINNREPFIVESSVLEDGSGTFQKNTIETQSYDYLKGIPASSFLLDASYLKLRELSLSYSFPEKWLSKTPFSSNGSYITLFAKNLKYWVAKENTFADPEVGGVGGASDAVGIETSTTPSARSFGVELRLTIR